MEKMNGSVTTENQEEFLFTYSEEERQQNTINRANAKLPLKLKYIVVPREILELGINGNDALVLAFIHSWLDTKDRFYFTNEQIGEIFNLSDVGVSKILKRLSDSGYVELGYKRKADGGQIRFVKLNPTYTNFKYQLKQSLSSNLNKVYGSNNNISNNKEVDSIRKEILKTYNEVFNRKVSLDKPTQKNIDYWLTVYSLEEIKQAIIRAKYFKHNWWVYRKNKSNEPNLSMLFRQKNTKQEKVDYIGELLNLEKPTKDQAFFLGGITDRLLNAGMFDLKGGEYNG